MQTFSSGKKKNKTNFSSAMGKVCSWIFLLQWSKCCHSCVSSKVDPWWLFLLETIICMDSSWEPGCSPCSVALVTKSASAGLRFSPSWGKVGFLCLQEVRRGKRKAWCSYCKVHFKQECFCGFCEVQVAWSCYCGSASSQHCAATSVPVVF